MDRGEFIRLGFTVWPAANGGWVVNRVDYERYAFVDANAAFSSFADMIAWLNSEHRGLMETKYPPIEVPEAEDHTAQADMRIWPKPHAEGSSND